MIPKPQPSLVINYFYLWNHEAKTGQENGIKTRPCLIISAEPDGSATSVIVAPITTSKPDLDIAVEIPPLVLKHLGMKDDVPSYIICTEANTFIWPGVDISPIANSDKNFAFGFIPPRLFEIAKEKISGKENKQGLRIVSRTE